VHHCQAKAKQSQKQQVKRVKPGIPDLSELSQKLQQEWHPDNNLQVGGIKVTPHSGRRVLWVCRNCPAGCPHIWRTSVSHRTDSTKCPFCEGKRVCKHNSLATVAPPVARYWNHDKNATSPDEALAGSNSRAEWKCPDCNLEWQAAIKNRVHNNSGCPQCCMVDQKRTKQPTFKAAQHRLLSEWDYELNGKEGIHPHNTTLASNKLVHWVYRCCPEGQLHLYRMRPFARTGKARQGCPYCAGKQVCLCNSLQTLFPGISLEWDAAKNDGMPADVTSSSHKVVWWKDEQRGSWMQSIEQRTRTLFAKRSSTNSSAKVTKK